MDKLQFSLVKTQTITHSLTKHRAKRMFTVWKWILVGSGLLNVHLLETHLSQRCQRHFLIPLVADALSL